MGKKKRIGMTSKKKTNTAKSQSQSSLNKIQNAKDIYYESDQAIDEGKRESQKKFKKYYIDNNAIAYKYVEQQSEQQQKEKFGKLKTEQIFLEKIQGLFLSEEQVFQQKIHIKYESGQQHEYIEQNLIELLQILVNKEFNKLLINEVNQNLQYFIQNTFSVYDQYVVQLRQQDFYNLSKKTIYKIKNGKICRTKDSNYTDDNNENIYGHYQTEQMFLKNLQRSMTGDVQNIKMSVKYCCGKHSSIKDQNVIQIAQVLTRFNVFSIRRGNCKNAEFLIEKKLESSNFVEIQCDDKLFKVMKSIEYKQFDDFVEDYFQIQGKIIAKTKKFTNFSHHIFGNCKTKQRFLKRCFQKLPKIQFISVKYNDQKSIYTVISFIKFVLDNVSNDKLFKYTFSIGSKLFTSLHFLFSLKQTSQVTMKSEQDFSCYPVYGKHKNFYNFFSSLDPNDKKIQVCYSHQFREKNLIHTKQQMANYLIQKNQQFDLFFECIPQVKCTKGSLDFIHEIENDKILIKMHPRNYFYQMTQNSLIEKSTKEIKRKVNKTKMVGSYLTIQNYLEEIWLSQDYETSIDVKYCGEVKAETLFQNKIQTIQSLLQFDDINIIAKYDKNTDKTSNIEFLLNVDYRKVKSLQITIYFQHFSQMHNQSSFVMPSVLQSESVSKIAQKSNAKKKQSKSVDFRVSPPPRQKKSSKKQFKKNLRKQITLSDKFYPKGQKIIIEQKSINQRLKEKKEQKKKRDISQQHIKERQRIMDLILKK